MYTNYALFLIYFDKYTITYIHYLHGQFASTRAPMVAQKM